MPTKTSTTDPIRVDFCSTETTGPRGRIGMTFAPGKNSTGIECRWARDLETDLIRLRDVYRADILVSLIEDHEPAVTSTQRHPPLSAWRCAASTIHRTGSSPALSWRYCSTANGSLGNCTTLRTPPRTTAPQRGSC